MNLRRPAALALLGGLALLLQGSLAAWLPDHAVPGLAFLLVVGTAVGVGGAEGLLVAAVLGWAADVLSGALLGQHVLLWSGVYLATRAANRQLNLLRGLPRATLVAALSALADLALLGLVRLFGGMAPLDWVFARQAAVHAAVNAALAPAVIDGVCRLAARLGDDEDAGRRPLRMVPRGRVAPGEAGR